MRAEPAGLTRVRTHAPAITAPRTRIADGAYTRLVGAAALAIGLLALAWSFRSGYLVIYGDAASHPVMSRRILDSLTPGLAQVGTTWLPLPHLLLQPFIYFDWLYRTGLAASIVGVICFALTCLFVYRMCYVVTRSEPASLVGAAVVGLNPSYLYLQTTPMTEPVLLASFAGAAYFLVRWSRSYSMLDLVFAGYCACLASLSRYDGWVLIMAGFALVPLVALLGGRGRAFAEAHSLAFLAMAINGPLLWALYHLLIFNDPIYFIRNPFSAQAQQSEQAAAALLPTKGNLILSWSMYNWAVIAVIGPALVALGVIGLVLFGARRWRTPVTVAALLLLAPYAFNVLALVIGQTTIVLPQFAGGHFHNLRYGLMALLPVAFGVACLAAWSRRFWPLVAVAVVLQAGALVVVDGFSVLHEGFEDIAGAKQELPRWLAQHYDGGLILMDPYMDAGRDAGASVGWRTGLPLHNFVHDGNHPHWENALEDPRTVRWVVLAVGDRLDAHFKRGEDLEPWFEQVYADPRASVYRRRAEPVASAPPAP